MGVSKYYGREREKKTRRSSAPYRGKSTAIEKSKKKRAGASQLEKGIGIL